MLLHSLVLLIFFISSGNAIADEPKLWAKECYTVELQKDDAVYAVLEVRFSKNCTGVRYYDIADNQVFLQGDHGIIRDMNGTFLGVFPSNFTSIVSCQTTIKHSAMTSSCTYYDSGGVKLVIPALAPEETVEMKYGNIPVFVLTLL